MKKKLLSIVLTVAMVLTMLPLSALAASWTATLNGKEITLTEDAEGNITAEGDGAQYYTFTKVDAEQDKFNYYEIATGATGQLTGTPAADPQGQAAAPVIAPDSKVVEIAENQNEATVNVTITCATAGAKIYYTKGTTYDDTEDPTPENGTEYSAAFDVTVAAGTSVTIKAIAVKDGMEDSEIAAATYTAPGVEGPTATVDAKEESGKITVDTSTITAQDASDMAEAAAKDNDGIVEIKVAEGVLTEENIVDKQVDVKLPKDLISAVQDNAYSIRVQLTGSVGVLMPAKNLDNKADATLNVTTTSSGVTLTLGGQGQDFDAPVFVDIKVSVKLPANPVVAWKDTNNKFWRERVVYSGEDGCFSFVTRHFSDFEVMDAEQASAKELKREGEGRIHNYKVETDESLVVALKTGEKEPLDYIASGAITEEGEIWEKMRSAPINAPESRIENICVIVGQMQLNSDGTVKIGQEDIYRVDPNIANFE